jgi:zinc protease
MLGLIVKSIPFQALLFLTLGSSCAGQTPEAAPTPPQVPLIHKVELLNGLRLVIAQTRAAPRIALNLLIKAGSAQDPPNKAGTAYLTALSLRFANQLEADEQFSEELEDVGAELRIRVDEDSIVFHAEVPLSNLDTFLDVLSHMVLKPLFSTEGVRKLKQKLVESKIESAEPLEFASQRLKGMVFGKHPYGRSMYGTSQSLAEIRLEDLAEFHKTYFCPNNAVLVISGNLETSFMGKLVREKLGGWVRGAKVEEELLQAPVSEGFSILAVEDKREDVALVFGHVGPPRVTPDFYAATIMNLIVGGAGNGSRLAQGFLAKDIGHKSLQSEFQFHRWGGLFQVAAVVPSSSVGSALKMILEIIQSVKSSPVSESELTATKKRLLNWHNEVVNSPSLVADQVAAQELYDLASDFLVSFPKRVQQVTKERVEEVSRNYLSTSRAAAVIVGDSREAIPELKQLGTLEVTEKSATHE